MCDLPNIFRNVWSNSYINSSMHCRLMLPLQASPCQLGSLCPSGSTANRTSPNRRASGRAPFRQFVSRMKGIRVASYCSGGKGNKENSEVLTIMLTGEFVSSVARYGTELLEFLYVHWYRWMYGIEHDQYYFSSWLHIKLAKISFLYIMIYVTLYIAYLCIVQKKSFITRNNARAFK